MSRLIIFDFDGVVVDSELLANTVLAEALTELGVPTSLEDSYRLYMGKRMRDVTAAIEATLGRALPADFSADLEARRLARFGNGISAVKGVREYIASFAHIARCIASSSPAHRIAERLETLQLSESFGDHVFSAAQVARGKPHPDIFLHAAERMGVKPDKAIVIEDSPSGVEAGIAAGMTVIGLLAASHVGDGHEARLRSAEPHFVARTYGEAETITRELLASP